MKQTLLFDLFGVIAHSQSGHGRKRLTRTAGVAGAAEREFWNAYWQLRPPYDQGLVTGADYWQRVGHTLGIEFDERHSAELVEADIASWSSVDAAMVDYLGELAGSGHRLALLSNIPAELAGHYDRHPWLDRFQVCAFSCRIGHVKPQPAAFRWCLEALDAEAGHVLFIDDRPDNIRAARSLHMQSHLFKGLAPLRDRVRALTA